MDIPRQITESWPKFHTLYKNLRKIAKWTIRPCVKSKTINLFEKKSSGPSAGQNDFCHDIKAQPIKIKYFIKSKNACFVKDTINEWKRQTTEWQEIFSQCIFIKGWYLEYNDCLNSAGKK